MENTTEYYLAPEVPTASDGTRLNLYVDRLHVRNE